MNNAVFSCGCGLRTDKQADCGDAGICVTANLTRPSDGISFCALASTPDSKCLALDPGGIPNGISSYCDDGHKVDCQSGFAVSSQPCACTADTAPCTTTSDGGDVPSE